jgi:hypothetical protein
MEPLLGYRAWRADREGRLCSMRVDGVWWQPGVAMEATCHKPVHRFDEPNLGPAPHDANHPCGWHAYSSLGALLLDEEDTAEPTDMRGFTVVHGLVEGGGRTQEHEHGWRAQYALPVAIIRYVRNDPETRSQVLLAQYAASERYGIPLIDPKEA